MTPVTLPSKGFSLSATFFRRRTAAAATVAVMLAAPLVAVGTAGSANASPAGTGLVISEVYGGGGNTGATLTNDFIELYNPTAAAISVAGMSVRYRSASGSGTGFTNLTGSVPGNGHYLIQEAAGTGGTVALTDPDVVGTLAMSGTAGAVALVTGQGTVVPGGANTVDLVGFGSTAVLNEGSPALGASNSASVSRDAARSDTDNNANDFTAGTPDPQNSSDVSNPNAPVVDTVSDMAFPVDGAITPFTLTATGGATPYVWSADGLPTGLTLDTATGEITGTPTVIGASGVTVTVTDANDATATASFSITVNPASGTLTPIASIQGTDTASPMGGATVTTRGVVTATYPTGGFNGYIIQTAGSGGDLDLATHTASTGLFVFSPATVGSVSAGDYVEVTGTVSEFFGLTELTVAAAGDLTTLSEVVAPPKAITNTWPATDTQRESIESMLFAGSGTYTISNTYSTNQYGEFGLALGTTSLKQWTDVAEPGSAEADAVKADNVARGVTLDDGASTNFLSGANSALTPPYVSLGNPLRVGETTTFVDPVIVDYRNNAWKLQPTAPVTAAEPGQLPGHVDQRSHRGSGQRRR